MEEEVVKEVEIVDNTNHEMLEKFDSVIELLTPVETTEEIEVVPNADTETLQQIAELLEQQNILLTAISEGSATILVYGLIIVPLIVICTMLWWFFKQFLYNY